MLIDNGELALFCAGGLLLVIAAILFRLHFVVQKGDYGFYAISLTVVAVLLIGFGFQGAYDHYSDVSGNVRSQLVKQGFRVQSVDPSNSQASVITASDCLLAFPYIPDGSGQYYMVVSGKDYIQVITPALANGRGKQVCKAS